MMCTTEEELIAAFDAEINKPAGEIDIHKLDELATQLGSRPLTKDEKKNMQLNFEKLLKRVEQDKKCTAYSITRQ